MTLSISPLPSWRQADEPPRPSSGLSLFSKTTWDTVKVLRTRTMGKGLFAARDIPQGGYVLTENSIISIPVPRGRDLGRVKNHPVRLFLDAVYALDRRDRALFMNLHSDPAGLARLQRSEADRLRIRTWCRLNRRGAPDPAAAVDEATRAVNIWMTNRASVYAPAQPSLASERSKRRKDGRDGGGDDGNADGSSSSNRRPRSDAHHDDDGVINEDDPAWDGWPYAGDGDELAGVAVFPLLSRINHSCAPNAAWSYIGGGGSGGDGGGDTRRIAVRALRPIAEGEQVLVSYLSAQASLALSREERRAVFRDSWGFVCRCRVCRGAGAGGEADGTEANVEELVRMYADE